MNREDELLEKMGDLIGQMELDLAYLKMHGNRHRENPDELHVLSGAELSQMYEASYEVKNMLLDTYKESYRNAKRL